MLRRDAGVKPLHGGSAPDIISGQRHDDVKNLCMGAVPPSPISNQIAESYTRIFKEIQDRVGAKPNCCITDNKLMSYHVSTILPSDNLKNLVPLSITCFPVGGIPKKSPVWVPLSRWRIATRKFALKLPILRLGWFIMALPSSPAN
jgi:hypothetical protein